MSPAPTPCLRLPCSAFRQAAAKVSAAAPQSTPNVGRTAGKGRKSANGTAPTCFVTVLDPSLPPD